MVAPTEAVTGLQSCSTLRASATMAAACSRFRAKARTSPHQLVLASQRLPSTIPRMPSTALLMATGSPSLPRRPVPHPWQPSRSRTWRPEGWVVARTDVAVELQSCSTLQSYCRPGHTRGRQIAQGLGVATVRRMGCAGPARHVSSRGVWRSRLRWAEAGLRVPQVCCSTQPSAGR